MELYHLLMSLLQMIKPSSFPEEQLPEDIRENKWSSPDWYHGNQRSSHYSAAERDCKPGNALILHSINLLIEWMSPAVVLNLDLT